ncbi:hypothetical protein NFI96_006155 [Prochilodus magdalenae]|nr:hypothetical protein NFI96_006155 [Prochilodus magdalenae]
MAIFRDGDARTHGAQAVDQGTPEEPSPHMRDLNPIGSLRDVLGKISLGCSLWFTRTSLLFQGNLCRCTGYRPIADGFTTFCDRQQCCQNKEPGGERCRGNGYAHSQEDHISEELFQVEEFLSHDPTQDIIFPPELLLMGRRQDEGQLCFQGDRVKCISPVLLKDLIQLRAQYPEAPLLVGNTTLGGSQDQFRLCAESGLIRLICATGPKVNLTGAVYPVLLHAGRIPELRAVSWSSRGLRVGAGCSLSALTDALQRGMEQLKPETSRGYRALIQTLQRLAAKQIRNVATIGGNIMSADPKYDLSSVLAAAECTLHIVSRAGAREVCLSEEFFTGFGKTALEPDEILLAIDIPHSKPWEFVSAFRQAQRREFAFSIVNAGMRVVFRDESPVVESLDMFYGGMGATLVKARTTGKELIGRVWDEKLLTEGTQLLKEELSLSPAAPGGRVEYRRTLALSFFFKFYMQVLLELQQKGIAVSVPPPENLGALKQCGNELPHGLHTFQMVSGVQSSSDPVGRPRMHQAAFLQATGEAQYYDDIPALKGELFVSMVTSTRAHAKISLITNVLNTGYQGNKFGGYGVDAQQNHENENALTLFITP